MTGPLLIIAAVLAICILGSRMLDRLLGPIVKEWEEVDRLYDERYMIGPRRMTQGRKTESEEETSVDSSGDRGTQCGHLHA
jgi:hypothetical protein